VQDIKALALDAARLEPMPVDAFVELFLP
jgi:hypothetical protein